MRPTSRFSPPKVGAASLLVIFTVLCLAIFSLLSLSTALADRRLSDAAAQTVQAYYEADAQAELLFARLRAGERPEQVQVSGNRYSYVCPVSGKQQLQVLLQQEGENWTVLRWQLQTIETQASDAALPVWDGG